MEMKYALMSYGIPADFLPLDAEGYLVDDDFKREVEQRRAEEEVVKHRLAASSIIQCPTQFDVLLGRGRPYQDFPGNIRLHQMIDLRRRSYETLSKSGKTAIVVDIVHAIHKMGGRFLKRTSDGGSSTNDGNWDRYRGTMSPRDVGSTGSGTIASSSSSSSSWEEAEFAIVRKKVSNCFHTRKNLAIKSTP